MEMLESLPHSTLQTRLSLLLSLMRQLIIRKISNLTNDLSILNLFLTCYEILGYRTKLEPSGSISRVLRTIFRKSFKSHGHNWKSLTDRDQLMIWREFKVYITT